MAPVLVERDAPLSRLLQMVQPVEAGRGQLALIGGEAGLGKTTLLDTLLDAVSGRLVIRRGTCDVIGPPPALGPVLEAFPELDDAIEQAATDRGALFRRLAAALTGPTLLALEDLHWADEASLNLLGYLGRRLGTLPLLVAATFRDDEAPPASPLGATLGDLARVPGVVRLALEPLSVDGVRQLVEAAGSPLDPAALHGSTDGNPFFVSEILAAGGSALPATVRDAVLARAGRLSGAARQVLGAAAVLGDRAELRLLLQVSGAPADAVDECVRAGMLLPARDGLTFRHELARQVVEQSEPPGARARLHAVALQALQDDDEDDGRLAHHAAASGDRHAVLAHAPRAAAHSARLGAHREAAELYRLALRCAGRSHPSRQALCEALSYECYLTNEIEEALAARQEARALAAEVGDARAVGGHLRWLSRLSWYLGRRDDEQRFAREAVAVLERAGDEHALAGAYATLAAVLMHVPDTAAAVAEGRRALELARRLGDVDLAIHALATIGTALLARDGADEGWRLLHESLDLALAHDAQEHVGRAYLNLSANGLLNRRYAEVDDLLAAAVAYCEDRDLYAFGNQIVLGGARSMAEQGRYREAEGWLARVRHRTNLSPVNLMAVHHVSGQVAVRRTGDDGGHLDETWRLSLASGEEQQMVPAAQARGEAHWIAGRVDRIAADVHRVWPLALAQANPWSLGELCWWLSRAGEAPTDPVEPAEPFRLMLDGAWSTAARRWEEVGCPLWAAYALGCSPAPADGRRALAIAEGIGAAAAARAIVRDRQARGLSAPVGPRAATRANPGGLTRREREVLDLLAEGLSNHQLAQKLFLSERTVAHHVSAVLQKLGEPTRARAVAAARRRGLLAFSTGPEVSPPEL